MKNILVLGGSQFMGKTLIETLSKDPEVHIFYINRNKKYWNNEIKALPDLTFYYGDREHKEDFHALL